MMMIMMMVMMMMIISKRKKIVIQILQKQQIQPESQTEISQQNLLKIQEKGSLAQNFSKTQSLAQRGDTEWLKKK